MRLEGSCHCRKVRFTVDAAEPVPFMRCYCSICRKTAGAAGYAINLGADTTSMKVTGKRHLGIYRARIEGGGGDTPLPQPPENVHIMLGSRAAWVRVEGKAGDPRFDAYPDMSLKEWHAAKGLRSARDPQA